MKSRFFISEVGAHAALCSELNRAISPGVAIYEEGRGVVFCSEATLRMFGEDAGDAAGRAAKLTELLAHHGLDESVLFAKEGEGPFVVEAGAEPSLSRHAGMEASEDYEVIESAFAGRTRPDRLEAMEGLSPALSSLPRARRARIEVVPFAEALPERDGLDPEDERSRQRGRRAVLLVSNQERVRGLSSALRLASQMRSTTRLYRSAVHELRAPLNAIVLNLDLVSSQLARRGEEQGPQRHLEVVRREITRLSRTLETLLAQTRARRSSPRRFDLRRLVRETISLVRAQARAQQVALEFNASEEPITVRGHRDQLKQALLNIVINALEAMPRGGRLSCRVETAQSDPTLAYLVVEDEGPGIPAEIADRLFELHFTTKSEGSGIGLFVAHNIVAEHGGRLELDSRPDQGTEARISLPLDASALVRGKEWRQGA